MIAMISFNYSVHTEGFFHLELKLHVLMRDLFFLSRERRLVGKTTQLEGEKMQKEAEVQKLMEENVKLSTLLDKKEAQLLALNEQCKMMALSASNM